MKKSFLLAALFAAGAACPVDAEEAPAADPAAVESSETPAAPAEQPESAEAYERRVQRELREMDNQVNQLRKGDDLTAEQKGALTTYRERRKVVSERLGTVNSADAAQFDTAKTSVDASLVQLQNAFKEFVDLFEKR